MVDWSQYITPLRSYQHPDWGHALSSLIQSNQWANEQERGQREFAANQQRLKDEQQATLGMQRSQLESENRRFAAGQSNILSEKAEDDARKRFEAAQKLAADTRQMIAHGRTAEALANIGTLRDMGVDAKATKDEQGNYAFHIGVPSYSGPEAPADFASQYAEVSGHPSAQQPGPVFVNPFDTHLGTLRSAAPTAPPNEPKPPAMPSASPEASLQQPPTPGAPPNSTGGFQAAPPQIPMPQLQAPAPMAPPQVGAPDQGGAPAPPPAPQAGATGDLNSGELGAMNRAQLGPLMQGIIGGMVSRYQPNAANLMTGFSALHDTPEGTLTAMAPILKDAVTNWNAEMAAEAQANKASLSASSAGMTDERQREQAATAEAERIAKEQNVAQDVQMLRQVDEVRAKLTSGNRNSQGDAIKQLIALREGHHISDKDFSTAVDGIASDIQKGALRLERVYHDGLPLSTVENYVKMLDAAKSSSQQRLRDTAKQMEDYSESNRSEAERYSTKRWIKGHIPTEFQSESMKKWNPMASQGGAPSAQTSSRASASVSVPIGPRQQSSAVLMNSPPGELGTAPLPPTLDGAGEQHPDDAIDEFLK